MKKMISLLLMGMCVLTLGGCNEGSVSCGIEEREETEQGTDTQNQDILEDAFTETQENDGVAADVEGSAGLQTLEVNEWGLTLHAEDVSPTGLTIVCTQSGGSPTGELATGSYYRLEKEETGTWVAVDYKNPDMEVGWTAEAWMIPMNDTVEWEVDWEWLYGSLPAGHYRIGKEIMDFRGTGDYDKAFYYAEFEIN
ncbi:MAG: hypothetical protein IJZ23_10745 [Roseburia sp.]|nr:hypothetical protein [Roseburia sp.]